MVWQRHRILWLSIAAGWGLIAVSFTLNYYRFASHYVEIFRTPPTLAQMFVWEAPYWILWAMLVPVVFKLTRSFPIGQQVRFRHALLHAAFALALAILHRVVYLPLCWLLYVDAYRNRPTLWELYASDLLFNLPTGLMCYGTILLVSHVIDYYERFQAGEVRAAQLETQLTQAQLQALRMQLQPHFLFNTLNSISALQLTDSEAANRMTARLGDFLRLTLDNVGTQEVSLRQEMEFLHSYLAIERLRFQERLQIAIEVEPEALDANVPNLILQPIVENAIKYAVVMRVAPGEIKIRARRLPEALRIEVQDNGLGLSANAHSTQNTGGQNTRGGVGLTNTQARLRQLYGEAHRFTLENAREGGVIVTLEVPVHTNGAVHE